MPGLARVLNASNFVAQTRADKALREKCRDAVTGLPNRLHFRELLQRALDWASGPGDVVSVLVVDVRREGGDYGSSARPDHLLVEIAGRLMAACGPLDTVARLDTNLFGMILVPSGDITRTAKVAARALHAVRSPVGTPESRTELTGSVGIALSMFESADPDDLLRRAESALHRAEYAVCGTPL